MWKKPRPSTDLVSEQPAMKKRRSSGHKVVEVRLPQLITFA